MAISLSISSSFAIPLQCCVPNRILPLVLMCSTLDVSLLSHIVCEFQQFSVVWNYSDKHVTFKNVHHFFWSKPNSIVCHISSKMMLRFGVVLAWLLFMPLLFSCRNRHSQDGAVKGEKCPSFCNSASFCVPSGYCILLYLVVWMHHYALDWVWRLGFGQG